MKHILIILLCMVSFQLLGQINESGAYIAVIGKASSTYNPDMIRFSFYINVSDKKQLVAVQKLNDQVELMITRLVDLGTNLKDIKLIDYNLSEKFDYTGDKPKSLGYEASESFELEINYSKEKFNLIVDSISSTKFPNLTFTYSLTFSDSLQIKIKNELISKASDNAMEIAATLAKSRNVNLGGIYSIEYTGGNFDLYGESILPPPPPPPQELVSYSYKAPELVESVSMKGITSSEQVRIIYRINNAR